MKRITLAVILPAAIISITGCNYSLNEAGLLPKTAQEKSNAEQANETQSEENKPVNLETAELSFKILKSEIFDKKCMNCHTEEKSRGTVLETKGDLELNELISETVEESTLYKVVVPGLSKRFMPPVKSGIPALTTTEVDYLKRWLDAGAPE